MLGLFCLFCQLPCKFSSCVALKNIHFKVNKAKSFILVYSSRVDNGIDDTATFMVTGSWRWLITLPSNSRKANPKEYTSSSKTPSPSSSISCPKSATGFRSGSRIKLYETIFHSTNHTILEIPCRNFHKK